jgi:hypothetical protein
MFKKRKKTAYQGYPHSAVDPLIHELVSIGSTRGYLPREPGRTREIGEELNRIGGMELMLAAHQQVSLALGNVKARELESAWGYIGQWMP